MKFKVGDKVEVVEGARCPNSEFRAGHCGIVIGIRHGVPYPYNVMRRNGNHCVFSARELKLIKKGKTV